MEYPINKNTNSATILSTEKRIHLIRNQRVVLVHDLAKLYGVTTHRLNEQVKRNLERFPKDFMFQLTNQEVISLRSQFAISKKDIYLCTSPQRRDTIS